MRNAALGAALAWQDDLDNLPFARDDAAIATHRPTVLEVLELRAWARGYLFHAGQMGLIEAVDPLQAYAMESGLADTIGQDAVQGILADQFEVARCPA